MSDSGTSHMVGLGSFRVLVIPFAVFGLEDSVGHEITGDHARDAALQGAGSFELGEDAFRFDSPDLALLSFDLRDHSASQPSDSPSISMREAFSVP